ncbi:hypothetical protein [Nonomuraea sp. NPDC049028]|uniref:hypothetical protein n=1 Tax=Nonomuraea sp. NPDC049028 TaxID=3364348 RepID=UPI003715FE23
MTMPTSTGSGSVSLYRLLCDVSPSRASEDPPDTLNTKAVETIDEDASFALLRVPGLPLN